MKNVIGMDLDKEFINWMGVEYFLFLLFVFKDKK